MSYRQTLRFVIYVTARMWDLASQNRTLLAIELTSRPSTETRGMRRSSPNGKIRFRGTDKNQNKNRPERAGSSRGA
jgi:hypothetical protein